MSLKKFDKVYCLLKAIRQICSLKATRENFINKTPLAFNLIV